MFKSESRDSRLQLLSTEQPHTFRRVKNYGGRSKSGQTQAAPDSYFLTKQCHNQLTIQRERHHTAEMDFDFDSAPVQGKMRAVGSFGVDASRDEDNMSDLAFEIRAVATVPTKEQLRGNAPKVDVPTPLSPPRKLSGV